MKPRTSGSSIAVVHLDLTGTVEDSRRNLRELSGKLEGKIEAVNATDRLTLTNEHEYLAKFAELMGHTLKFQITHAAPDHDPFFSVLVANELLARMEDARMEQQGAITKVEFPGRATIEFGRSGIILTSSNPNLLGKDCLRYIACNVHEDFGVIRQRHAVMTYDFDSAMFEKTPKDVRTGENRFIGRDFVEFHSQAKTFGHMLPQVFRSLLEGFYRMTLDMLTIDLRGANVYTNGSICVRRFERDHVVPIYQRDFKGMIVYTDVFFQDVNETKSPFEGGSSLEIHCPVRFGLEFRVM
jgi:hypothetical protein